MSNEAKTPEINIEVPQCQFFVLRKKRLCRMTVKPGRRYCGEHEPQPTTDTGEVDNRIPCPNDPKHTCYASKLEKHLSVCNARRTEQPAYIVENINAPEAVEDCPRRPLSTVPKDTLMNLIAKINHLYDKYLEEHITTEPQQPIHHTVAPEFSEPGRTESSLRHLRQTSALLWLVEREGLARDNTCYVELGAGKGQLSYYACHAWCGGRAGRVLAVDRAPLRHKRDNKLRSAPPPLSRTEGHTLSEPLERNASRINQISDACEKAYGETPSQFKNKIGDDKKDKHADNVKANEIDEKSNENISETEAMTVSSNSNEDTTDCSKAKGTVKRARTEEGSEVAARLRADLAHLALAAVPAVAASAGVVGLAKHLCGVATDYALRCVAAPGVLQKTRGVVLATCCHHRCERAPYVASRELQELGIDAEEFTIMLGLVSWATSGDGRGRRRPAPRCAAREQRAAAGRRAKALLDYGRALWLRARGFDARLARFVPAHVSPENLCLVATKR